MTPTDDKGEHMHQARKRYTTPEIRPAGTLQDLTKGSIPIGSPVGDFAAN